MVNSRLIRTSYHDGLGLGGGVISMEWDQVAAAVDSSSVADWAAGKHPLGPIPRCSDLYGLGWAISILCAAWGEI